MKRALTISLILLGMFFLPRAAQAVERGYTGYEGFDGLTMKPFHKYPDSYTYDNIKEFYAERQGLAEELKRQRIDRMRNRYGHKDYNEFKPGRSKAKSLQKRVAKTSKRVQKKARRTLKRGKKALQRKNKAVVKKAKITGKKVKSKGGKGVLVDLAIAVGLGMHNEMKAGASAGEAASATFASIKEPSFLFGHLLGGAVGAGIGSMIPVPAVRGVLGGALKSVPVIGGAMLVGSLASEAISLWQDGNLTLGNLMGSVDFIGMSAQIAGASLGAALGSVLIPIPGIGSIVGGIVGGLAFDKLLSLFRGKIESIGRKEVANAPVMNSVIAAPEAAPASPVESDYSIHEAKDEMESAYRQYVKSVGTIDEQSAFQTYVSAKDNFQALMNGAVSN